MVTYIFENTRLWSGTLAPQGGSGGTAASRERLRSAFMSFRGRVELLASEIHRDLPDYTVHDITHLDALWEMADIIAGEGFPLTPTEAFVLGGAILLHDLGMGLASYPGGLADLRKDERWVDTVTGLYLSKFNRLPTADEISDPAEDVKREAVGLMLRVLHAPRAEQLAADFWRTGTGDSPQYLIEDTEIRQAFGRTIGRIAHSHWWPVERLEHEFRIPLGAPHWAPADWTVDPLKIACLLRVADAGHIDARRAPTFLRAVRRPGPYSDEHWKFQERLQKPHLVDDALAYTSGAAFQVQDAQSWWLCLDTLTMIDRELRSVDALLADRGARRFAARRVAGIESPERLRSYIQTDGWTPMNATVQVSDVPRLVRMFGGEELYGDDPTAPVRELIQNAADAVRARRFMEGREHNWGEIYFRVGADGSGDWVEVEDSGIGMSSEVLTRYLLDFGTSYWGSSLMVDELPGLLAKGIKPTGKYGIGFFSVFMLGDAVRIRTRRHDVAPAQTLVMEFNTGLSSRPLLRPATPEERIRDGGTCVRVWLRIPAKEGLLARHGRLPPLTLERLCQKVCPSLDVNLSVQEEGEVKRVISSSDWIDGEGFQLLVRVYDENSPRLDRYDVTSFIKFITRAALNLRLIVDEKGEKIGRACIAIPQFALTGPYGAARLSGAVTVGGLFSCRLDGIAGVLAGTPVHVSRNVAKPLVSKDSLASWATEQADLVPQLYEEADAQAACAEIIRLAGGATKNLPICIYRGIWVSYDDIAQNTSLPDEVLLLNPSDLKIDKPAERLMIEPNVMLVDHGHLSSILQTRSYDYIEWPGFEVSWGTEFSIFQPSLGGTVVEALAEAWGVTVEAVLGVSDLEYRQRPTLTIGHIDGDEVVRGVLVVRRPS